MTGTTRTRIGDRPLFNEIPIDAFEERLQELEKGNTDVVIPAQSINYTPDGLIKVGDATYGIPNWPFRQLAKLVGHSARTLRAQPSGTGKASRHALVTYGLEKAGEKQILLRLKDTEVKDEKTGATGRVRGILTTGGKTPMSARDLLSTLRPYLRKYNMAIQLGNAREQAFHLRTLFRERLDVPKPKFEGRVHAVPTLQGAARTPGQSPIAEVSGDSDAHTLGVHWRMSEVGFCPLTAELLIYRLVCQNGMIAVSERTSLIDKRLSLSDEEAFRPEVGLTIERARERQTELMEKLTRLRDSRIVDGPSEIRTFLVSRSEAQVNDEFIKKALAAWDEEPIASKYGVLQALTRAAKTYHPDFRVVFESVAGIYMERSVSG